MRVLPQACIRTTENTVSDWVYPDVESGLVSKRK